MNKKELEQLINVKAPLCVSVIVPTSRLATFREADAENVNKAINKAEQELKKSYSHAADYKKVVAALNMIAGEMDFTHLSEGLGIYVGPGYSQVVKFPFHVTKKIKVGDSFDNRDALYMLQNITEYYIFSISKKYLRLYKCLGESIEELSTAGFPMVYEEEFEYARPSVANSYANNELKNPERDKSFLQEERLIEFLRTADEDLKKYLPKTANLVVTGDSKDIADFMEITSLEMHVIATVKGSYVVMEDLARNVWKELQSNTKSENEKMPAEITELIGKKKAIKGLDEIWDAVYKGKGLKLVIEKDYTREAYISMNEAKLMLKKPVAENEYICIPDITDVLIKAVRSKGGEVMFVENGSMKKFDGIALLIRYN